MKGKNIYRIRSNVVDISISQGHTAIIDIEDLDKVLQYRWYAHKGRCTVYAIASTPRVNSKRTTILMHRMIMSVTDLKIDIDHRDHNGLNNCRSNLRICTRSQNMMNQMIRGGTSKHKGVSWQKNRKKWESRIRINGKKKHLGYFTTEIEAANAYDKAADKLFGEFANINF